MNFMSLFEKKKQLKRENETKIFKRINKLYETMTFWHENYPYISTIEPFDFSCKFIFYTFNSFLGKRYLSFYRDDKNLSLRYRDENYNDIFSIEMNRFCETECGPVEINIEPMLGEELTAHDIDLAILEFETFFYETLEKQAWEELEIYQQKQKKHLQEITKLV